MAVIKFKKREEIKILFGIMSLIDGKINKERRRFDQLQIRLVSFFLLVW